MKSLKKTLLCSSIVGSVWLALCATAGILATEWALHPGRRSLQSFEETQATNIADRNHAVLEPAALRADDGSILRGWYIRVTGGNGDAVILLHGQSDNRAGMLGTADLLLRHGYSVLIPDARGQGTSGGAIVTYGVKEADDIRRWANWLDRTHAPSCIDALGDSMGAAQLLQSLKSHPGFCAVVAESSFASFQEASYDRIGEWVGTGPWIGRTVLRPVVWAGLLYARLRYGIDLAKSNPEEAVAASHVPVLLIHGLKDNNLPPRHSENIMAKSRGHNGDVVLWEPPEAGHCGAAGADPQEYERRVVGWFEIHHLAEFR